MFVFCKKIQIIILKTSIECKYVAKSAKKGTGLRDCAGLTCIGQRAKGKGRKERKGRGDAQGLRDGLLGGSG